VQKSKIYAHTGRHALRRLVPGVIRRAGAQQARPVLDVLKP
jgi:hypothetical protein